MSDRLCDKSALATDYTPSTSRDPSAHDDHTSLSVPGAELELHQVSSDVADGKATSSEKKKQSFCPFLPPRRLAFCGGGVRGVAHIGVLKVLKQEKLLHCIKEVIGISAGSLFALLYTVGYSLVDMERLALEFDFSILRTITFDSLLNFPLTFGLDHGDALQKLITSILRHQNLNPTITFAELAAERPLRFRCYATELQGPRVKEFSLEKTPNVPIAFACRASMSLPFLYTPVKDPDSNALYMDGGLLNNLPLAFLTSEEIQETLGVLFTMERTGESSPIETIFDMFRYMYDAAVIMKTNSYLTHYKDRIVRIPLEDFSSVNFSMTSEDRSQMIRIAEDSARAFLYKGSGKKPARRYSVS